MKAKRFALVTAICFCLITAECATVQGSPSINPASPEIIQIQPGPRRANFNGEMQSGDARSVADWVVDSGDNATLPFIIVDKINAKAFVFGADGNLRAATPVLVGLMKGDRSIPGVGAKKLSEIRPRERITPAGRFVTLPGRNLKGKDILWVDYENALSVHRVEKSRQKWLKAPTPLDKRVTLGCIVVPVKFFDDIIGPIFTGIQGIIYVLPEERPKNEIFTSYYDVESAVNMRPVSAGNDNFQIH